MISKLRKRLKAKPRGVKRKQHLLDQPMPQPFFSRMRSHVSNKLAVGRNWYNSWSGYWRHFFWAVLIGIVVEVCLHLAHDAAPVKNVQNWVLDKTLFVFSQREKTDENSGKLPVIIAIDDAAHQSPEWGNDRPLGVDKIAKLIAISFDRGATHVMVDFTLDDEKTSQKSKDAIDWLVSRYGQLNPNGEIRHLYVARSIRPDRCTPNRIDTDMLRTSIWESIPASDPISRPGLVIHSVFPHYIRDPDYVVRGWHLFGVTGYEREISQQKDSGLAMLPSPQLAYYAVLDLTQQFSRQSEKVPQILRDKLPWLADHGRATLPAGKSAMDRSAFAKQQLDVLSGALQSKHLKKLCTDHPSVMGCSVGQSQAQHVERWKQLDSIKQNELTDELERHLPRPQEDCRSSITATLKYLGQTNTEQGKIYNRILYGLSPWSEPALPFTSRDALKRRGHYVYTPGNLGRFDEQQPWAGRFVAIGGAYASSGDWYQTPVGHAAGVFINVNAMSSMAQFGPISEPPKAAKLVINLIIILMVAAIFAAMNPIGAAITSAAILLGSLVIFHEFLLSNGMWIEFGAPLLGINIHRFIDDFLARRRERNALKVAEDERLIALGRVKLLQDRIAGSAWQRVDGDEEIPPEAKITPDKLDSPTSDIKSQH